MTDIELDNFFVQLLKNIHSELKESYEAVQKYSNPVYDEIKEDYKNNLSELETVISQISTIDDFADLDDDIIDHIYEDIYDYASNYIISIENREKDIEEYKKVEEILFMFEEEE